MSEKNQRNAPRKYADYVVELYDPEGFFLMGVGRLLDLSATGALVESARRLAPGQGLLLRLRRGQEADVDLSATVIRVHQKASATTYGLKFIRTK